MTYSYDRTTETIRFRDFYAYLKVSMSLGDAEKILGVPPGASEEDIRRAYKRKVFENHPDRGGDPEKMVEVNVAKEILEGKRRPDHEHPGGGPSVPDYPAHWNVRREPREVSKKVVTFEEAAHKAGVPMGFPVTFKTMNAYHSFDGETTNGGTVGFVAYGTTGSKHIFVGAENYRRQDITDAVDHDLWEMHVYEFSASEDLAKVAPGAIRKAFSDFKWVKESFNNKVVMTDDAAFDAKIVFHTGQRVSFKDVLVLLKGGKPEEQGRKLAITLLLGGSDFGENDTRTVILDVNGRRFDLGHEAFMRMYKGGVLDVIFGTYWYPDSKKTLTRLPKPKAVKVFQWMHDKLPVDEEVKGILLKAVEQMT